MNCILSKLDGLLVVRRTVLSLDEATGLSGLDAAGWKRGFVHHFQMH